MSGRLGMTGAGVGRGDKLIGLAILGQVSKRKGDRSGEAVGAGSVIAAGGLLGGGIPGTKPDSARLEQIKAGHKVQRARHISAAYKGGIFGYRTDAHEGFLHDQKADEKLYAGTKTSRVNHYHRGVGSGKIKPEEQIIQHMRRGRIGSNIALAGGGALAIGGARQHHQRKQALAKRAKSEHFGTDATIAGGAATTALAGGGALTMEHQGRKWSKRGAEALDEAERINRRVGGHTTKTRGRSRVPDVAPRRGKDAITNDKKILAGRSNAATEAMGRARGAALQHRYFAGVYGGTALKARKVAGLGALVTAGGLGAKQVQKAWATGEPPLASRGFTGRIPGTASFVDNRGEIHSLHDMPKMHPADPQRVLATVRPRNRKRKLVRTGGRLVAKAAPLPHGTKIPRWEMQWRMNDKTPGPSARYKVPPIKVPGAHEFSAEHMAKYPLSKPMQRKRTLLDRYLGRPNTGKFAKVETTMSEHEAGKLAGKYDTRGPLPKGLTREQKMKAYEARYIASGGKKAEKWKRRADAGEVQRNVGLAIATGLGAGSLLARHPRIKTKHPKAYKKLEVGSLTGAVHGGAAELYSEHARSRRASYQNSPGGVAGSALSRMQAYTPGAKS